uniref:Uncharacterized protein n=1 Tax=Plectus sambesii TaxID=2011161 RepID=A0A914V3H4_9BILA
MSCFKCRRKSGRREANNNGYEDDNKESDNVHQPVRLEKKASKQHRRSARCFWQTTLCRVRLRLKLAAPVPDRPTDRPSERARSSGPTTKRSGVGRHGVVVAAAQFAPTTTPSNYPTTTERIHPRASATNRRAKERGRYRSSVRRTSIHPSSYPSFLPRCHHAALSLFPFSRSSLFEALATQLVACSSSTAVAAAADDDNDDDDHSNQQSRLAYPLSPSYIRSPPPPTSLGADAADRRLN